MPAKAAEAEGAAKGLSDRSPMPNAKELAVQYVLAEPERLKAQIAKERMLLSSVEEDISAMDKERILPGSYDSIRLRRKKDFIDQKKSQIAILSKRLDLFLAGEIQMPDLVVDNIQVGRAGRLTSGDPAIGASVVQIVDETNVLLALNGWNASPSGKLLCWVKMPTAGLVDDVVLDVNGWSVVVIGTKRYALAAGGSKTVFVLERVDPGSVGSEVRKRMGRR